MNNIPKKLLIAASGTGGHLFPAIAVAEQLPEYQIEWLGVPDRLEQELVPDKYPLHTIAVGGFQSKLSFQSLLQSLRVLQGLIGAIFQVRKLLNTGKFAGLFTTGGYIAAPAILAAKSLGLPVVLHESNAIPGKVTRWCSKFCDTVALGFGSAVKYLPEGKTTIVGTPVRSAFRSPQSLSLPIPDGVLLIVVVGGSQGAIALNKLVRQCAPAWLATGAWIVHLTGDADPDATSFQHPQYLQLPFYDHMAALFQRADLALSRAGSGSLTELAVTGTPALLIPYPYAAEDHQAYNAKIFAEAGAALVCRQADLTPIFLENQILELIQSPEQLKAMTQAMQKIAVVDSAERLAIILKQLIATSDR